MTRNLKEFVNQDAARRTANGEFARDHVTVLLAMYQGGATIAEQLESIRAQTHSHWSLIVSDDGSTDDGPEQAMLFAIRQTPGRVRIRRGPGNGAARNFLSLVKAAGAVSPFVAFADQDDVWLPEKLARAVDRLKHVPEGIPALYCGRTMVCDCDLIPRRASPLFTRPPGFANALVQNIGGGNTMVLNRAALDLVQDTLRHAEGVVAHDWWVYQLVSGAGGKVFYDTRPTLLYRQHGANQVGANDTLRARLTRIGWLMRGRFRDWNDRNAAALDRASHWLTPEARATLDAFHRARSRGPFTRMLALRDAGLYRQTRCGNLALWIAAVTRRL